MPPDKITPRAYRSPKRTAAVQATYERIVEAALGLLREGASDAITLDAVGKAAGVTRPTVYNQFGSRRALIEAMFDRLAATSALTAIPEAMREPDPDKALRRFIQIFCDFWASQPPVHLALERAGRGDPELEASLAARVERRRGGLTTLVRRFPGPDADPARASTLIDLLFVLTGRATYAGLAREGRDAQAVYEIICDAAFDAVRRFG